jgi:hypothetical protein
MTAALLAAAVAAVGCGSSTKSSAGKFTGERKQVAEAVEDLQSAGRDKDADRICKDLLAQSVVARLKKAPGAKNDCGEALGDSLDDADAFDMDVQSVTVSGANATARVKSEAGKTDRVDTLTLVKEGGKWKLATISS